MDELHGLFVSEDHLIPTQYTTKIHRLGAGPGSDYTLSPGMAGLPLAAHGENRVDFAKVSVERHMAVGATPDEQFPFIVIHWTTDQRG